MKILYKSLPADRQPNGYKFKLGVWHKHEGDIEICKSGFHASKNAIDAMGHVNCFWLAKVEVKGKHQIQDDKECWEYMRIIKWVKWTKKDSVAQAIYAAELVLDNYEKNYPNDLRPREAIEAAKKVLKNDTVKNRSAAWSARSAALSAAESAWSAAWSAAESAWSAAESAWSAAWAAESAAESARSAALSAESAEESARSAALSAAESARSAAESARSAALSAAKKRIMDKCHKFVIERKKLN